MDSQVADSSNGMSKPGTEKKTLRVKNYEEFQWIRQEAIKVRVQLLASKSCTLKFYLPPPPKCQSHGLHVIPSNINVGMLLVSTCTIAALDILHAS